MSELESHLATLSNRTPEATFRQEALPWFAAHAEASLPALIESLGADGPRAARAATALGALDREESIAALADALSASNHVTRRASAAALAGSRHPAAVDALIAASISPEVDVASAALYGLTLRAPDPAVCEPTAPASSHPDEGVRAWAEKVREHHGCGE